VIVTGVVADGFCTDTVNVNDPPGSGRDNGSAAFVTAITGRGVNDTVAIAIAVTVVPLFTPVTVTVSVCDAPPGPLNGPVNEHGCVEAPGANVTPINAPHELPGRVARSPYTLSTSLVIVTGVVADGFDTTTVNVKSPPGSTRDGGAAAFDTAITGGANGVNRTTAIAIAIAVNPLMSTPVTVTVSVCDAPATPVNGPVNVHGELDAPGANVTPINAPHVLPARVAIFPYTLSVNDVIVIGSTADGFETTTVNVKSPPGSTRDGGAAAFVTAITGAGIATDSFAALHADATAG
jgi:hypothetical protein